MSRGLARACAFGVAVGRLRVGTCTWNGVQGESVEEEYTRVTGGFQGASVLCGGDRCPKILDTCPLATNLATTLA